jgi:hypothetical protein
MRGRIAMRAHIKMFVAGSLITLACAACYLAYYLYIGGTVNVDASLVSAVDFSKLIEQPELLAENAGYRPLGSDSYEKSTGTEDTTNFWYVAIEVDDDYQSIGLKYNATYERPGFTAILYGYVGYPQFGQCTVHFTLTDNNLSVRFTEYDAGDPTKGIREMLTELASIYPAQ